MELITYPQTELEQLRADWQRLEHGAEMTYFQTYEWNRMLLPAIPADNKYFEALFLAAKQDGEVVMIAPLWVIKRTYRFIHHPMIYIFGNGGWSDYLNFIYSSFSEEAAAAVMNYLHEHYADIPLSFSSLKSSSSLYQYINSHYSLETDTTGLCVSLALPATVDEWWSSLSKHSRQNMRTAQNRMSKEGVEYTVNFDDTNVDKALCIQMRAVRSEMKSHRDEKVKMSKKIKRMVKSAILHIPSRGGYHPIYDDSGAKIMTLRDNNGELMAYFHYGYDAVHREIVVLSAGVAKEYERYSPGMLLMKAYIENAIKDGGIRNIDFTRGAEPYKLSLGGKANINHSVSFRI